MMVGSTAQNGQLFHIDICLQSMNAEYIKLVIKKQKKQHKIIVVVENSCQKCIA